MKVALDLMKEVPALLVNDNITKARKIMRDLDLREIFVTDGKETLAGYINITDVLRVIDTKSNITVEGYLKDAPSVMPDAALEEVAVLIREAATDSAVVVDHADTVLGQILLSDLIRVLITRRELNGLVGDYMSSRVVTCSLEDSIQKVYTLIVEGGHAAFPVLRNGIIVGIISRRDLLNHGNVRKSLGNSTKTTVESVMVSPALVTYSNTPISDAAHSLVKHKISRLPVLEENGSIVGILDRQDVLNSLTIKG